MLAFQLGLERLDNDCDEWGRRWCGCKVARDDCSDRKTSDPASLPSALITLLTPPGLSVLALAWSAPLVTIAAGSVRFIWKSVT